MKRLILITVFIVSALFATAQNKNVAVIKKVSAKDVKALIDTSTTPMIINFWATWCGPCIREIPWFDSIIAAKNSPVKLLLVSVDYPSDYPKQLAEFVQKQGYKGEVVYLNETNPLYFTRAIEKKWSGAIPASVFVNNASKYYRFYNEQIPKQRFEMELDKLMK